MSPYTTPSAPRASFVTGEPGFVLVWPLSCATRGSLTGLLALDSLIRLFARLRRGLPALCQRTDFRNVSASRPVGRFFEQGQNCC